MVSISIIELKGRNPYDDDLHGVEKAVVMNKIEQKDQSGAIGRGKRRYRRDEARR